MTKLDNAREAIAHLSAAEKSELVGTLISDLGDGFIGIESQPGVCGGEACIVRTRIPVWTIEQARRMGASDAELLRSFPTLRQADLVAARSYAARHREEIERAIRENEEA